MTARNDPSGMDGDKAAMLLLLEARRATHVGPVECLDARQIDLLCRPLGLIASAQSDGDGAEGGAASPASGGHRLALRFGALRLLLRWGGGGGQAALSGDEATAAPPLPPIWQGVERLDSGDTAWLMIEAETPTDDDRVKLAQQLCAVTALLASRLPVLAMAASRLCWLPNRLWSDPAHLADAVIAVERQGLPPVMHLVGFVPWFDGSVKTRGMAWFGLEDMAVSAVTALPVAEIVRRAARLVAEQMAMRAPLLRGRYPGIERDEWVAIEPADPPSGQLYCQAVVERP